MSARDLEQLLINIFSPVLKQEIMISGTGFLAVAAREAAASAKAEAQKEAQKKAEIVKIAAEKAAKKAKLALEKARLKTLKAREEAQKTREEAREALMLKTHLIVMRSWRKGISLDLITDISELPSDKVKQLVEAFEKVETYFNANANFNVEALRQLSNLKESEIKALWALLKK